MNISRLLIPAIGSLVLFAGQVDARTLYVNSKRPNNNGSGLSLKKAKKTLQAAVNIAKKGDTILVYNGTYSPIRTNNKKITIKSVDGAAKAKIAPSTESGDIALAQLGKTYTRKRVIHTLDANGQLKTKRSKGNSYPLSKGRSTKLRGFTLDGKNRMASQMMGVSGGNVSSCVFQRIGRRCSYETPSGKEEYYDSIAIVSVLSKLTSCTIQSNSYRHAEFGMIHAGILSRCRISNNSSDGGDTPLISKCTLDNSLVSQNAGHAVYAVKGSVLVNCTIVDNALHRIREATSASWTGASSLAANTDYTNCILFNNKLFSHTYVSSNFVKVAKAVMNKGPNNQYLKTTKNNTNPKFRNYSLHDYRIKKSSPFYNKGKSVSGIAALDLMGFKRVYAGKIDRGCYEYAKESWDFKDNDPGLVACVGDSITEGFRCAGDPYPTRLQAMSGKTVLNYGVGGTTVDYGSSIIADVVAQKPGYVCIQFGANDAIHHLDLSFEKTHFKKIIEVCKKNGCKPLLATPTPQIGSHERFNGNVSDIAYMLRSLAAEQNVTLVDLNAIFGGNAGYFNPEDGLHLSDAGGWTMANAFNEKIR